MLDISNRQENSAKTTEINMDRKSTKYHNKEDSLKLNKTLTENGPHIAKE